MSITASLSNALSGLQAASRAADLISSNVANALTEGYGRRTLEVSSRVLDGSGAGVTVDGVRRQVDAAVLADRRAADSTLAASSVNEGFLADLESAIGHPGDGSSLAGRVSGLESTLIAAASLPESNARLGNVLRAAKDLAGQISGISDQIQDSRTEADHQIATGVDTINDALSRIEKLNADISVSIFRGNDASALMDQRQQQVDRVAQWLPLREVQRDNNQIAQNRCLTIDQRGP